MKRKCVILAVAVITAFSLCMSMAGCGGDSSSGGGDVAKLTIVQQYGMAYAPLKVIEQKGLIEENYDGDVEVNFQTLNSGASINDALDRKSVV